ncbi:recombinase family protein [Clostridium estertheticum]|uniref:recombinase family protein n=1 Tax=Clostridium estertheticum TaxID=238834 RepID=UPI00217CE96C|nr:recombinase family protein [Clostridium estertheticum]
MINYIKKRSEQLNSKGVIFISLKESIDTPTPTGVFMLTVFGAVAQLEREYIKDRQRGSYINCSIRREI